ncbi:FtsK/SpoIIIE domain-containing protein [Psittacicella hinzii]|uniref:FtsK domain-containing protein n=1 Tax=Psittacicella hinzii TaxID=2028575 RepID=A0A3A1YRD2_9GAMM|nr:FtsK/SpoIIIE domain-containing protein [Psittacicella hinzii]RIY38607.1 hypothetical protein CKF58_03840 [Psittacicella hinzii]
MFKKKSSSSPLANTSQQTLASDQDFFADLDEFTDFAQITPQADEKVSASSAMSQNADVNSSTSQTTATTSKASSEIANLNYTPQYSPSTTVSYNLTRNSKKKVPSFINNLLNSTEDSATLTKVDEAKAPVAESNQNSTIVASTVASTLDKDNSLSSDTSLESSSKSKSQSNTTLTSSDNTTSNNSTSDSKKTLDLSLENDKVALDDNNVSLDDKYVSLDDKYVSLDGDKVSSNVVTLGESKDLSASKQSLKDKQGSANQQLYQQDTSLIDEIFGEANDTIVAGQPLAVDLANLTCSSYVVNQAEEIKVEPIVDTPYYQTVSNNEQTTKVEKSDEQSASATKDNRNELEDSTESKALNSSMNDEEDLIAALDKQFISPSLREDKADVLAETAEANTALDYSYEINVSQNVDTLVKDTPITQEEIVSNLEDLFGEEVLSATDADLVAVETQTTSVVENVDISLGEQVAAISDGVVDLAQVAKVNSNDSNSSGSKSDESKSNESNTIESLTTSLEQATTKSYNQTPKQTANNQIATDDSTKAEATTQAAKLSDEATLTSPFLATEAIPQVSKVAVSYYQPSAEQLAELEELDELNALYGVTSPEEVINKLIQAAQSKNNAKAVETEDLQGTIGATASTDASDKDLENLLEKLIKSGKDVETLVKTLKGQYNRTTVEHYQPQDEIYLTEVTSSSELDNNLESVQQTTLAKQSTDTQQAAVSHQSVESLQSEDAQQSENIQNVDDYFREEFGEEFEEEFIDAQDYNYTYDEFAEVNLPVSSQMQEQVNSQEKLSQANLVSTVTTQETYAIEDKSAAQDVFTAQEALVTQELLTTLSHVNSQLQKTLDFVASLPEEERKEYFDLVLEEIENSKRLADLDAQIQALSGEIEALEQQQEAYDSLVASDYTVSEQNSEQFAEQNREQFSTQGTEQLIAHSDLSQDSLFAQENSSKAYDDLEFSEDMSLDDLDLSSLGKYKPSVNAIAARLQQEVIDQANSQSTLSQSTLAADKQEQLGTLSPEAQAFLESILSNQELRDELLKTQVFNQLTLLNAQTTDTSQDLLYATGETNSVNSLNRLNSLDHQVSGQANAVDSANSNDLELDNLSDLDLESLSDELVISKESAISKDAPYVNPHNGMTLEESNAKFAQAKAYYAEAKKEEAYLEAALEKQDELASLFTLRANKKRQEAIADIEELNIGNASIVSLMLAEQKKEEQAESQRIAALREKYPYQVNDLDLPVEEEVVDNDGETVSVNDGEEVLAVNYSEGSLPVNEGEETVVISKEVEAGEEVAVKDEVAAREETAIKEEAAREEALNTGKEDGADSHASEQKLATFADLNDAFSLPIEQTTSSSSQLDLPQEKLAYEDLPLLSSRDGKEVSAINDKGEIDFSFLDTDKPNVIYQDPFSAEQRTKTASIFSRGIEEEENDLSRVESLVVKDQESSLSTNKTSITDRADQSGKSDKADKTTDISDQDDKAEIKADKANSDDKPEYQVDELEAKDSVGDKKENSQDSEIVDLFDFSQAEVSTATDDYSELEENIYVESAGEEETKSVYDSGSSNKADSSNTSTVDEAGDNSLISAKNTLGSVEEEETTTAPIVTESETKEATVSEATQNETSANKEALKENTSKEATANEASQKENNLSEASNSSRSVFNELADLDSSATAAAASAVSVKADSLDVTSVDLGTNSESYSSDEIGVSSGLDAQVEIVEGEVDKDEIAADTNPSSHNVDSLEPTTKAAETTNGLSQVFTAAAAGAFSLQNLMQKAQEQQSLPQPSKDLLLPSQIFDDDNKQLNDYVRFLRQNLDKETSRVQILERMKVAGAHRYEIALAPHEDPQRFIKDFNRRVDRRKLHAKLDGKRIFIERYLQTNVNLIDVLQTTKFGDAALGVGLDKDNHQFKLNLSQGNSVISGSSPESKSNLLTSILVSLAFTHSPEQVEFLAYCDNSHHAIFDLKLLPHFIHPVLQREQAQDLFAIVYAELIRRRRLCARLNAADYINYNQFVSLGVNQQTKSLPKIRPLYVFVDGIGKIMVTLTQTPHDSPNFTLATLIYLIQHGKAYGINFVMVNNDSRLEILQKESLCQHRFELYNLRNRQLKDMKPNEFIYNEQGEQVYNFAQTDELEINNIVNFWDQQVINQVADTNDRGYNVIELVSPEFYRFAVMDEIIFTGKVKDESLGQYLNFSLTGEMYKDIIAELAEQNTLTKRNNKYLVYGSYLNYLDTPLAKTYSIN